MLPRLHRLAWCLPVLLATFLVPALAEEKPADDAVETIRLLPPGPGNPRNSEGDFIQLTDGRILFVYTHFTGGGADHSTAHLASRVSSDGGRTWSTKDVVVVPNEGGFNVMSVSLLRLADGRIAMFYARKNSHTDCRPVMRVSTDEAKTWSEPIVCIPDDEVGYYVLNNDRVVQLASGRLVVPVALHHKPDWKKADWNGHILCYLSDDVGKTWRANKTMLTTKTPKDQRVTTQEPGVIALADGRLMLFCRTNFGTQYLSFSSDQGETFSELKPSNIYSPCSPATIERIPGSGELLMVWNNHEKIEPALRGKRTPLSIAISRDEGKTWVNVKNLADDPLGWYCYTAMEFVGDHVLLSYCASDLRKTAHLAETDITRLPIRLMTDKP